MVLRGTEKNIISGLCSLSCHLMQMDGFVLPPFESTYILKDKDVVRFCLIFDLSPAVSLFLV